MQVAIGGAYRKESIDNPSANPQNDAHPYDRYYGVNSVGAVGSRNVKSAFFEINAPVLDQLVINGSGRYDDWFKIKCVQRQEFVVAGYLLRSDGTRSVGALVLGYYDGGTLTYAGRVGTGFSDRQLDELARGPRIPEIDFVVFEAPRARAGQLCA